MSLIIQVGACAAYHFVSEENIMVLLKYPDLSRQEAEHQKLLEAFSRKVKDYQAGSEDVDSLLQFLMDGFVSHTSLEDRRIGDHLRERKWTLRPFGWVPPCIWYGLRVSEIRFQANIPYRVTTHPKGRTTRK